MTDSPFQNGTQVLMNLNSCLGLSGNGHANPSHKFFRENRNSSHCNFE